ncbi:SET domain-containing protein [Aureobasidium sp. EXF-10728]|nr:SET domain-containing protein [Aureobasidium sp. EXF-10728]
MPSDPPTKKRKTSNTSLDFDIPEVHAAYVEWAIARGIKIHGVTPAVLSGRGVGLLAKEKIKKDAVLFFVPEKAMIKPDLAALRKHKLTKLSSQAQLAAYLTLEWKSRSPTYVASRPAWPTPEDFASCMLAWSPKDELEGVLRKWAPPSVQKPLDRMLSDLKRDIESVKHMHAPDDEAFEREFLYHWMLVNTRSFHWKPQGVSQGAMIMNPALDYMNHCPNGQGCEVTMSPQGYELKANRDYESGEEILATYGAHSNDKLLVHYGFILSNSLDDDEIRLDHVILPRLTASQQSALQDVGFLGGYALLPSSGELCFKTQVAVRSVLLTANEWEHFMGSGEDLADDKENEVLDWLKAPLESYVEEAKEAVAFLKTLSEEKTGDLVNKLKLLQARWEQIQTALEDFLK